VAALAVVLALAAPAASPARPAACRAAVVDGVLPAWARSGFSDPKPRLPYVLGRSRRIAALLFGRPLRSPPAADHNNKILWVSRAPSVAGSDLRIRAQRMRGSAPVGRAVARRVDGSPGPSIIDLPAPGCWRLTLRWSGRVDTLDLRYS
jgi:hypothetical protein